MIISAVWSVIALKKRLLNVVSWVQWLTAGVFSVGPLISSRMTRWNTPRSSPLRSLCCKYTGAFMHVFLVSMVSVSSRDKLIKYWVFLCFVYYDPNPGSVLQFIHFINIKNSRERSEGKSLCHKAFSSPLLHPVGFVFTTLAQPVFV